MQKEIMAMSGRLRRSFYTRSTLTVAKDLLGKFLVRRFPGGAVRAGMIVETEAYIGPGDKASHAYGGKRTPRNVAEWMIGGHVYIYLVYGMYWQLNISTGKEGSPECVLIRALEPVLGNSKFQSPNPKQIQNSKSQIPKHFSNLANGPGKLCRWMKLDKSFYGENLTQSRRLWVESRRIKVSRAQIVAGPRINIDYAGPHWAAKPWRFYLKGNPAVSKPHL